MKYVGIFFRVQVIKMDIEEFKNKCKSQKEKHDERKAEFDRIETAQEQYEKACYEPLWMFFGKPKCPVCCERLNKEIVDKRKSPGLALFDFDRDIIYTCDCGYEYAATE